MPSVESLKRPVILQFPSLISLLDDATGGAPRSWIQLAVVGKWKSNRYGEFAISKQDLSQMLHNWNEITPKDPTELPIDYDHLSMDPKKPGDGVAAGWLKGLELREDGKELWGQVEWTPKAATAIENKEYRFVSPSFVKDHVHKNGVAIGTTLLAAAITNHPFLEGMAAVTLSTNLGDVGVSLADEPMEIARAVHLAEVGQFVTFKDDPGMNPELSPEDRGQTLQVKETDGEGDHQFVRLATRDGKTKFGWFRVDQLAPADAPHTKENSPMPKNTTEAQQLSDTIAHATRFAARVMQLGGTREAIDLATREDNAGATAYYEAGLSSETLPQTEPVISLAAAKPDESFDALVAARVSRTRESYRDAVHRVGLERPDLAASR